MPTESHPSSFDLRPLTAADIPAALKLCEAAHWNQTEADWRRLLELEPDGCFAAVEGGTLLGTGTTARYDPPSGPGSFGWIGMMLVDPEQRRRGIGSAVLRRCMDYLEAAGVETIRLDATPLGKTVYDGFGFRVEYELERWKGEPQEPRPQGSGQAAITPLSARDMHELAEFDAPIFGAHRAEILEAWRANLPECAFAARRGGELVGYVLARTGLQFQHVGPVIGDAPEVCEALLAEAFRPLAGKLTAVDRVAANAWTAPILEHFGLTQQRQLTRMFRGPNASSGQPGKMLAICCPELG